MTSEMKTVADAMALATLRQEWSAAFALADKLIELKNSPETLAQRAAAAEQTAQRMAYNGYDVYHWPETVAFMKRLGVDISLNTREISFTLREGEVVLINHSYIGHDNGPQTENLTIPVYPPRPPQE